MSDFDGSIDPTSGSDLPQGGNEPANVSPDNLASPFLKNVAEADRPVVAKYLQEWDRGVQQRFAALHEQYKPYKEFGDPDRVRAAIQLSELFDQNPQDVHRWLSEQLGVDNTPQPQQVPNQNDFANPWEDLGIPDEFAQMVVAQQELLEALVGKVSGMDTASQDARDQSALDDLLGALHEEYGDYDETFVMTRIVQGADPKQAVADYNQMIQNGINSRTSRPAPAILGGSGSVPSGGVDLRKASSADVRSFLADQLNSINSQK